MYCQLQKFKCMMSWRFAMVMGADNGLGDPPEHDCPGW
jgi:hypothetical protein